MATGELVRERDVLAGGPPAPPSSVESPDGMLRDALAVTLSILASLRLTVALFALSIFLVFVGTLAQVDRDVWFVVNEGYFRVWFAKIDFIAFERLVQLFRPAVDWNLSGGFYFFGGKTLGLALLVNLLAAHTVRFKLAANGRRLGIGFGLIGAGLFITAAVIRSGMNEAPETQLSPEFCNVLWHVLRGTLALLALAGAHALVASYGRIRRVEWLSFLSVVVLVGLVAVWLLVNPQARLDDSGLRILWQLIKGTAAGLVLLAGCVLAFRRRAGIVLLHGGITLLMLSELATGIGAVESQMRINEGETVSFSSDIRTAELAVIDRSDPEVDRVTVVPASLLVGNFHREAPLAHDDLPFKIKVHRWLANSRLRQAEPDEPNPATAGFGLRNIAVAAPTATGVDAGGEVDMRSAYIELIAEESGESLGTFLVSQGLHDQPVEVDGRTFDVSLRYKQIHWPFTMTLKEFRFDRYTGTNTPKNYSSHVVLRDPERHVDRDVLIWMNNPLRYAGTTFYQSSFDAETERATVLQVVTNPGWMAPYVACMLVATGMLAHFGVMLVRFLRRRAEEDAERGRRGEGELRSAESLPAAPSPRLPLLLVPTLVVVLFGGYVASKARMPQTRPHEMRIHEFAKLPLAFQGRIKPYDTVARNSLQILSGRQELREFDTTKGEVVSRSPAIRWLLDVIAGAEAAGDHRVFRIENLDVLDTLELKHRPLFWSYSLNEIHAKPGELARQIELAAAQPEDERSLFQRKMLDLASKRNFFTMLSLSFRSPPLAADREQFAASLEQTQRIISELRRANSPHAVPPVGVSTNWAPLMEAELTLLHDRIMNQPINPATVALSTMLAAYADGDVTTFNRQLTDYRRVLAEYEQGLDENRLQLKSGGVANAEILSQRAADFEVFYNHFSPFYYAAALYVFAFVFGAASWLGWTEPLRRSSIWLLWLTFALHTFALVARVYISGRPPVTNLYSTAIFIGWACVLLALVFEAVYRLGLGNIIAAVIGSLTLLVAHFLSLDGDTFIVLQAVLDTQFWLATHVITINMGYSTVFLAGAMGALYILLAHVFPVLDVNARRQLTRMMYGTLCFAIFFSFVGTVLGGLWADDSWGRFWGWDPKENGALIIVLYVALVLHARWGGLVKSTGLATLAVGGNIVTTWSWFGVNELGVGLHAYGGSERATAMWLLTFAATQLAIMALGAIPGRWYQSLASSLRPIS